MGAGLCAYRAFVCLTMHTLICVTFSLPPGVGGWLRLLLVVLPELFYLSFALKLHSYDKIREMTYQTPVRPQLEYASIIWDPHTQQYTHTTEIVQRRAARWTMNDYARTTSVTSVLHQLGWQTLGARRSVADKTVNGLVAVPLSEYIQPTHRISRYCHSMTFRQIHTGKDSYKFSFFPLVNLELLFAAVPGSASLHKQQGLTPLVLEAFAFNHEHNDYVCVIRSCKVIKKTNRCKLKLKTCMRRYNDMATSIFCLRGCGI